jgi:hypothetical protein
MEPSRGERTIRPRRSAMIDVGVMLFVAAVLVVVLYGVVRPFTHVHYRHPSESQWRPLD